MSLYYSLTNLIVFDIIYVLKSKETNMNLEELSRIWRKDVGDVGHSLGLDGSPHQTFEDLVPKRKTKKKGGRPKGRKNLTIRERLLRAYEDD